MARPSFPILSRMCSVSGVKSSWARIVVRLFRFMVFPSHRYLLHNLFKFDASFLQELLGDLQDHASGNKRQATPGSWQRPGDPETGRGIRRKTQVRPAIRKKLPMKRRKISPIAASSLGAWDRRALGLTPLPHRAQSPSWVSHFATSRASAWLSNCSPTTLGLSMIPRASTGAAGEV